MRNAIKKILRESFLNNDVIFVRTKNFDNTGTINKLPYDGIQCWAIHKADLDKYIKELELWGGNKRDVEIVNPSGYEIYALDYIKTHKFVMGEIDEMPEPVEFDANKHVMEFVKQSGKSALEYISQLGLGRPCYQILLRSDIIKEHLNESVNIYHILYDVAEELSKKMYCDKFGSCVHFAEEFVLKINEINPELLNDFFVIEGYVDWQHGDDIPQQHTWIELKDGTKIDPTYEQFTKYGWANYSKKKPKKHTGLEYYMETLNGTWFSDRRQKYPEQFFK